jgi:hypothetical protein
VQQLFYKNIFIGLIVIFTTIVFFIPSAGANKIQDEIFEGYQIKFDYEKYPEEREIAYQYYLDKESKYMPGIEKKDIGIDLYDIDDDGEKEIFVYVNGEDACPRAGCPFAILRKIKTESTKTTSQLIPLGCSKGTSLGIYKGDDPKILNSSYLKYKDILFDETKERPIIWRWNGNYYD